MLSLLRQVSLTIVSTQGDNYIVYVRNKKKMITQTHISSSSRRSVVVATYYGQVKPCVFTAKANQAGVESNDEAAYGCGTIYIY